MNYDKILMETGKFYDNLGFSENWLVSGVDLFYVSGHRHTLSALKE